MGEFGSNKDEISLIALGTILLRRRWRILRLMVAGVALAVLWAWFKPAILRCVGVVRTGGDRCESVRTGEPRGTVRRGASGREPVDFARVLR